MRLASSVTRKTKLAITFFSAVPFEGKSGGGSCTRSGSKIFHHKRACRSRTGVCTFAYSFGRTSGKVLTYSPFGLIAWQLWKEHNARIFRGVALQPSMVLRLIQLEGENWIAAGAKNLGRLFCEE